MSILFSCSLFYLSFAPLWLSILFIDIKNIIIGTPNYCTELISIICIVLFAIISCIILYFKLYINGKEGSNEYTIIKLIEKKSITAEFLLSYILPLFAFEFTQWDGIILFLIFFCILAFLCVKHNYFSVNIIMEFAGFYFYECELKNTDKKKIKRIIISHEKLNGYIGETIYLKSVNNEYSLNVIK